MTLADNGVAPAGFRRPLPAANSGVPSITNTIYRVRPTTSCCGDLGVRMKLIDLMGNPSSLGSKRLILAPRAGFEPATIRLTVECSTAELPRNRRTKVRERAAYNKAFRACKGPNWLRRYLKPGPESLRATGICRGCEAAKALAGDNSNSHGPAPRFTARRALSSVVELHWLQYPTVLENRVYRSRQARRDGRVRTNHKETRVEAWEAVSDLLDDGIADLTIVADGRVYTTREFALTLLDSRD